MFCFVGFGTNRLRREDAMKTADRENPNSRAWLSSKPSPWGGRQQAFLLNQAGWKFRNFPAVGEVFFWTFPFIELTRTWPAIEPFGIESNGVM
jgi:hypothetical protein